MMRTRNGLIRARDAKKQVRDLFIAIGRGLYVANSAEAASLWGIAKKAGYTSSTINGYFHNRTSMLIAVTYGVVGFSCVRM